MDMIYYAAAVVIVLMAIVSITILIARPHGQRIEATDPKEQVRELVRKGILLEEEFVEMYFKVIRDEGFMQNFGTNQEEAKQLLSTMIEESQGHKQLLDNVLANLK